MINILNSIILCILISMVSITSLHAQDSLLTKMYVDSDSLFGNSAVFLSITNITEDTLLIPWPYKDEFDLFGSEFSLSYNGVEIPIPAKINGSGFNYVNLLPKDSTRIRIEFNNLSNGIPMDTTDHTFVFKTFPKGEYSGTFKDLKRVQGKIYLYSILEHDHEPIIASLTDSLGIPIMRQFIKDPQGDYEFLFKNDQQFNQFYSLIRQRVNVIWAKLLDGSSVVDFRVDYFNSEPVFLEIGKEESLPKTFQIERIYPNPFNPSTNIDLNISNASKYDLYVYNNLGQIVYSDYLGSLNVGSYTFRLNLGYISTGIYTVIISNKNKQFSIKKITLMNSHHLNS